jgi:hypothetical protein
VSRRAWYHHLDPVSVEISCGERRHRVSWRRGRLVLEDHDVEAERAFVALGGDRSVCVELLDAWREATDSREVLWAWSAPAAGDADMAAMLGELRARHQHMLAQIQAALSGRPPPPMPPSAHAPGGPAVQVLATPPSGAVPPPGSVQSVHRRIVGSVHGRSARVWGAPGSGLPPGTDPADMIATLRAQQAAERRRALLYALPDPLRMRLALGFVVRAARRQAEDGWWHGRRSDLEEALAARARPALEASVRRWRARIDADGRRVTTECWVAGPSERPSVFGLVDDGGGWAGASLPLLWLVEVWAPGLAVVDGCFVLAVTGGDAHLRRVHAVRWERRLPQGSTPVVEPAVAVRAADGTWHLRWTG